MARVPILQLGRKPARGARKDPAQPVLVVDRGENKGEPGHLIDGKSASAPEWAVNLVLRELGWGPEISFQVPIMGGRALIGGGQVLDFVLNIGPTTTVIDVRGHHWHGAAAGRGAADRFREMQLAAMPNPPKLIIVWENVAYAHERLRAQLLRELGAKR